ncbi:uncharacterized protein LOC119930107 [Tachyglossus aculeatus]|uniref:uncharacterized protein LOC119930107 n=1 Tax=Tachyglossus aculeatus TaxID=9261 RepID=UPI0018F66DAF|nr:uncharacterized protein LOC119930107 [Tachyglossus aculeatus]
MDIYFNNFLLFSTWMNCYIAAGKQGTPEGVFGKEHEDSAIDFKSDLIIAMMTVLLLLAFITIACCCFFHCKCVTDTVPKKVTTKKVVQSIDIKTLPLGKEQYTELNSECKAMTKPGLIHLSQSDTSKKQTASYYRRHGITMTFSNPPAFTCVKQSLSDDRSDPDCRMDHLKNLFSQSKHPYSLFPCESFLDASGYCSAKLVDGGNHTYSEENSEEDEETIFCPSETQIFISLNSDSSEDD